MEIQDLVLELFTDFVWELLQVLVPIAAAAASAWVVGQATKVWQRVVNNKPDLAWALEEIVPIAVLAAEQLGATKKITDKLNHAMSTAQLYLNEKGFKKVDLELLRAAIEAEVYKQFKKE